MFEIDRHRPAAVSQHRAAFGDLGHDVVTALGVDVRLQQL